MYMSAFLPRHWLISQLLMHHEGQRPFASSVVYDFLRLGINTISWSFISTQLVNVMRQSKLTSIQIYT